MNRSRTMLLASLALVTALAGCGVGTDESPRVIPPENVAFDLLEASTTTVTSEPANAVTETVYLFDSTDRLVPVERPVQEPVTVDKRLRALLDPLTELEVARGYQSRIPPGTRLASPVPPADNGVVRINLTDSLDGVEGTTFAQAIAQIVYTATESDDVREVRIAVDGSLRDVPDGEGVAQETVGRFEYRDFGPRG